MPYEALRLYTLTESYSIKIWINVNIRTHRLTNNHHSQYLNTILLLTLRHFYQIFCSPGRHQCQQESSSVIASVCLSVRLSVPNDVTALTFSRFQLSAWDLVGWCTVPCNRSLFEIDMPGNFCVFHGTLKLPMIGFSDQVWGTTLLFLLFKDFSYHPLIWWNNAWQHEANFIQKRSCSANFCVFHETLNFSMIFLDQGRETTLPLKSLTI